jgi:NosR/NirI family nitrous oxide reductase transcriptional regulator
MRLSVITIAVALTIGSVIAAAGQRAPNAKRQAQLEALFPAATEFSPKGGDPPHIKAFVADADSEKQLLGYAFLTTELEPLERGYDGPIRMLVGMDPTGVLAGIVVIDHNEPYGNFSVDPPEFAEQFRTKSIRSAFKVGKDIDAVSRATVTMTSATRAVKNSARRVARRLLTPPGASK